MTLCLKCKIKKLLNREKKETVEILSKRGIYLNTNLHELYIEGKRVPLTHLESKLMRYLIGCGDYCCHEKFNYHFSLTVTKDALRMLVSRLKRKIKYITGHTVIRSKYRSGYYID